jgi:MFS family permease
MDRRGVLSRIAPDFTALRRSRDYRVLAIGAAVSQLTTQAALVAIPFQVYLLTHSTALVGLIGAAELGPMVIVALLGGAIADRVDRRRLLLAAELATLASAGALAGLAFATTHPAVWLIFVLAALLAASGALEQLSFGSMIVGLAGEWLRSAIAFNFGIGQVTGIVGPGLGGILIAAAGVKWVYAIEAVSVIAMIFAALTIATQRPHGGASDEPIFASIVAGLRFVRSDKALLGSFVIDIFAMTFGMPRALFVVMSLRLFHSGAAGAGLLYASVSAGAALATVTNRWLASARRLGRITIGLVMLWGAAIALAGAASSLGLAALFLAIAGAADSISAVCRTTIAQLVTPDAMRGRMTALYGLVVTGGVRLGDIESGTFASVTTPRFSVVSGGLACMASVGVVMLAFPRLARFDARVDAVGATANAA